MENLKLDANEYLPLRDVVFKTLREAILRGDLKPGERLMELQLAAKLGVSRTPIREAIRMLQQEGLAVTIPRRGAEVAAMTEKDMEDVLQVREALEILAVQLASEKITKEQIAELEERLKVRNLDSEEMIQNRLKIAEEEIKEAGFYDYVLVNKDVKGAVNKLKMIIDEENEKD